MRHSFYMITFPLAYWRVRHASKWKFDVVIPIILSVVCMFCLYCFTRDAQINGAGGFLGSVLELFQILVGFYIASLTAISTFPNSSLDEVMAGVPPKLKITEDGNTEDLELTRRRFLALLFGYLAFASLIYYVVGVIINLMSPMRFFENSGYWWGFLISGSFWLGLVLLLVFFNLLVTTFLGLYYLCHRIYKTKYVLVERKNSDKS